MSNFKTFLNSHKKNIASTLLIIIMIISAAVLIKREQNKTLIKTPVIARTELQKKSEIQIKLFDQDEPVSDKAIEIKTTDDSDSDNASTIEVSESLGVKKDSTAAATLTTMSNNADLTPIIKNITTLELQQKNILNDLKILAMASKSSIEITSRIEKLESLNGNIGNLSNIFLMQQLVLLDNAFKVGGNQNMAIENILNFAKNIAKNEKVSAKLQDLLTLTSKQAIITPSALLFYADRLKDITLNIVPTQNTAVLDDSLITRLKEILKSFISIRKTKDITKEEKEWALNIKSIQESILFSDYMTVQTLLQNKRTIELGGQDLENFNNLFNTYLKQQQALQATLGAFIEGYKYDY